VRLDFLIKLYFALKEDQELAQQLLSAQLSATRKYAAEIAREQQALDAEANSFDSIVLESKASAARITWDWLQKCLDTSVSAPATPPRGS
jgi:hypothetical protein